MSLGRYIYLNDWKYDKTNSCCNLYENNKNYHMKKMLHSLTFSERFTRARLEIAIYAYCILLLLLLFCIIVLYNTYIVWNRTTALEVTVQLKETKNKYTRLCRFIITGKRATLTSSGNTFFYIHYVLFICFFRFR